MASKWWLAGVAVFVVIGVGLATLFFGARYIVAALPNTGFGDMDALMAKQVREARANLAKASDDSEKCDPLSTIAKDDFNRGNIAEARQYATDLVNIAAMMKAAFPDWKPGGYGDAVHDGNMVLGRIALSEHKTESAKQYLLKAGLTPGSPPLNSFGPNMSLAKDLLAAGERNTVIEYFHECRNFWSSKFNKLDSWEADVKAGETPNFGANLVY